MSGHHCHAAACKRLIPPAMLMCYRHWKMVPRALQLAVWRTYRDGQCDDWDITHAYAEAAAAAVRAVAAKEQQPEAVITAALAVYVFLDPDRQVNE